MTEFERFDRNARSRGVLIDTNLFVLFIVGSVQRDRISSFKRTQAYTPADWDLLTGLIEQIPRRYVVAHVLAEVSSLTDMKGSDLATARQFLRRTISLMEEVPVPSIAACESPIDPQLGLTDAAISYAVRQCGCSVLTNDSALYLALSREGASVVRFDDLRELL
ncbi:MAG TPA: hypothetical protein VKX45_00115 [Bryobacteraceae bacterium]|jgi:rRNA-processing protein FCF1|nr:hypothetical protein [Bryobacteraceae bacterium]